jgi:predicted amidophosphoribosyltransferase
LVTIRQNNHIEPLDFASFACYSPRGKSKTDDDSRRIKDAIKHAKPIVIDSMFQEKFVNCFRTFFTSFFNENTVLVPAPRSSLFLEGALWPSLEICKAFLNRGLVKDVVGCLVRTEPIRKSSLGTSSNERPQVHEQLRTLSVNNTLIDARSITIVDDVITMGRTSFACAIKLRSHFPDKEIRTFSVIRTQSTSSLSKIVEPCIGRIIYYPSGRTHREDDTIFEV